MVNHTENYYSTFSKGQVCWVIFYVALWSENIELGKTFTYPLFENEVSCQLSSDNYTHNHPYTHEFVSSIQSPPPIDGRRKPLTSNHLSSSVGCGYRHEKDEQE